MKTWNPSKLLLATTAALAAAIGTFRAHAQDVVVDTLDATNSVTLWSATWGTTPTLSFSTNNNDRTAQPAGSGSLRVESIFTTSTSWQQTVIIKTITNTIKASLYESVSVDVRVDPGSTPGTTGNYGYFEPK